MSNLIKGLIAGYGIKKLGGGCFTLIIIIIILVILFGFAGLTID